MSLTTTVEEMMTPRLLGRVASESGLSEAKVRNGVTGAVATIFGGLAGKATDRTTMGRVADLVQSSPDVDLTLTPERVLDDTAPTRASSNALLGLATGDTAGLTSRISSMLGIGGKAASGLVAAAASLALAAFKRLGRTTGGLDATRLATTLIDESREINAHLPTSMGMVGGAAGAVSGAIPHERAFDSGTTIRDRAYDRERVYDRDYMPSEEVERAPSRAWWWLAALIPLALLGYWLYNRSKAEPVRAPVVAPPAAVDRLEPERDVVPDQPVGTPGARGGATGTASVPPAAASMHEQPAATGMEATPSAGGASQPSSMTNQPGATPDEGGTVPTPTEPRDLPTDHPGATPMSPKTGPADTTVEQRLSFPAGSVETRFQQHIKSPTGDDETTWFELDQVTFATGKAKLEAASSQQLANVAAILKASPDVKIRVGGYTDATGNAAANKKLSQQRAEAVKQALIAQGIDASRIDTKGFGDQHKVVDAQGTQQANRRAAIRVLSR